MTFHDIPKETLDRWWINTNAVLNTDPHNWNAIRDLVLLENEYQRRGWETPKEQ